jgi:hypothetical protein
MMNTSTRISGVLGLAGGVALIAIVAWMVQASAPVMGGAGPMLGIAIAVAAAAVGGFSLLALRGPSRVWIVQVVAGVLVLPLGAGQYHLPALSWLLLAVGAAWVAAGGFSLAARLGNRRSATETRPVSQETVVG